MSKIAILMPIFLIVINYPHSLIRQFNNLNDVDWSYQVIADAGGCELEIIATFPPGSSSELSVDEKAEPFIRNIEISEGNSWQLLSSQNRPWIVPECSAQGCHIRYHFLLSEAADLLDDIDYATGKGELIVSEPSFWLIHPANIPTQHTVKLNVTTPPELSFVIGLPSI